MNAALCGSMKAVVRVSLRGTGAAAWIVQSLVIASSIVIPASILADTGHPEEGSLFGMFYVGGLLAATTLAVIIIAWLRRRDRNPSTGLPRPVRRRRARGPLT